MGITAAPLQASLWSADVPEVDERFEGVARNTLSRGAWVDHRPGWLAAPDAVFSHCLRHLSWQEGEQWMYDRMVAMPRRYAKVGPDDDGWLPVFSAIVGALGHRYSTRFGSCGANLYRDGRDSVAWHGDRVGRDRLTSLVAIVSVGAPRRFLLRPKGGGPSRRYELGPGDLLVMGGTSQRTWEHTVPKAAGVGPRISLTFRPWEPDPRIRLSPAANGRPASA